MAPNIFSCDIRWLEQLKQGQGKVVVTAWSEEEPEKGKLLEKLSEKEGEDLAVFVVDKSTCPSLVVELGLSEAGDSVIYKGGEEASRLTLSSEEDVEKIKKV